MAKDNLKWCFKKDRGIKLIEPNSNVAQAYLEDAKRDLGLIDKNEPKWNIIKEYYTCYNALYSLLMKAGIKCEIHDCTINLMSYFSFEEDFYNKMIELKKERLHVQYYLGQRHSKDYFNFVKEFLNVCETKFLELNDLQINEIREKLKNHKDEIYSRK